MKKTSLRTPMTPEALNAYRQHAQADADARLARISIRTFRDGNEWCAVGPGFINLALSPASFAATAAEAVEQYQLVHGPK